MGFFDSFTGKAQQREISRANASANKTLDQQYGVSQDFYNQARGSYDPYVQSGQQGQQFYNNALGLGGQQAMQDAYGTITSNPMFQNQLDQSSNAMMRYLNGRGGAAGGTGQIAAQRVFQGNIGNWLDRYQGLGQQGLQATGAQAGLTAQQGDNAFGYGATKAGNAINYGNAMAQAKGIGVNNMLNLAGAIAKAAGAFMGMPA